jgi:hypothetical protein
MAVEWWAEVGVLTPADTNTAVAKREHTRDTFMASLLNRIADSKAQRRRTTPPEPGYQLRAKQIEQVPLTGNRLVFTRKPLQLGQRVALMQAGAL